MKILIANPGSTSYKCKLYDSAEMTVLFEATVERIGERDAIYRHRHAGESEATSTLPVPDYPGAVGLTLSTLTSTARDRESGCRGIQDGPCKRGDGVRGVDG